jgi:hypothetical protein
MTDMNITLERIDSGLRELTREVRDLRAEYRAQRDLSWAWILGPVLLVVLVLIGVAAAEAIHELKALR